MTFKEWEQARDDSIKFAEETIKSIANNRENSELSKLFGAAYNDTVTNEIREYNKNIMTTLTEEDLYQIAAALNKIAEELVNAPRVMFKAPEATSRMAEWIPKEVNGRIEYYDCSACGCSEPKTRNYCPNCGAKMFVKTHDVYEEFLKEAIHDKD